MPNTKYGLVAIGNALVDVLAHASDEFIKAQDKKHGMKKGTMTLINQNRAVQLYGEMGAGVEVSGGSAGNTIACYACGDRRSGGV